MPRVLPPKAMKHQTVSLKHADRTPIRYDTSDPGTGKTFVRAVHFAVRRRLKGGKRAKCMLVIAPKSLLKCAWADDIKKFCPDMKVSVARADNRDAAFAEDADIYVTNTDAAVWLSKQKKSFFDRFDELVIDEITTFKHHTSQRSRAMAKVSKHFEYRSGLTGTPNSRSITDVWHQAFLLDGGERLGSSFYAFRSAVCEPVQVGRSANAINWHDKPGAEEAVFGMLSDIVIRHKFEDCVDIPANHLYTVDWELTPKQKAAYDRMTQDAIYIETVAAVARRVTGQTAVAIGINAAAVANKLLQISSGALYTTEDKFSIVDESRYEMVMDMVEQRQHTLVFFMWKHQRDLLIKHAAQRKLSYAVIDGSTSDKEREAVVARYQAGQLDVLFAHPRSAAHGLTLTRGTTTIWTAPTYDLELFAQGNRRQYRMGQKKKTETIVVVAKGTIEEQVYELLLGKNERMRNLLDLFATL